MKIYTYTSICTKVLDGDTLIFSPLDLGNDVFLKKAILRLDGINCPETRTKNLKEKAAGLKAKEFVRNLVEGKEIRFDSLRKEKFGRLLGIAYTPDGKNLNELLLKNGLAKEYHGEKREAFSV